MRQGVEGFVREHAKLLVSPEDRKRFRSLSFAIIYPT